MLFASQFRFERESQAAPLMAQTEKRRSQGLCCRRTFGMCCEFLKQVVDLLDPIVDAAEVLLGGEPECGRSEVVGPGAFNGS